MTMLLSCIISCVFVATSLQSDLDYYDLRSLIDLNPPKSRQQQFPLGQCYNTAAFVLVDALEISYQLLTGVHVEFSVQEVLDCHYSGCRRTRLPEMVEWFKTHDRLAAVDRYSPYGGEQHTCRSELSPDALTYIKIDGLKKITSDEVDLHILINSFVVACYDERVCPHIKNVFSSGIIDGPESDACTNYVLIIAFTPSVYVVRETLSSKFRENGYFRIKRNSNACGIESNVYAFNVDPRHAKAGLNPVNGCPKNFAKYCRKSRVCTRKTAPCVESVYQHTTVEGRVEVSYVQRPAQSNSSKCTDQFLSCPKLTRHCKNPKFRPKCEFTCGVDPSECTYQLAKYHSYTGTRKNPSKGGCLTPNNIPNGKVTNANKVLQNGEVLKIECNEGYVLAGHPMKCEVQDVFGPDTRLKQSCIRINSEDYSASGRDYTGHKNTNQEGASCQYWYDLFHDGRTVLKADVIGKIRETTTVNHNYCRNWVAANRHPVPYCYVNYKIHYCFPLPGCGSELCRSEDLTPDCDDLDVKECYFTTKKTAENPFYTWKKCPKKCCSAIEC